MCLHSRLDSALQPRRRNSVSETDIADSSKRKIRAFAAVGNHDIGALKPDMFAHAVLEPGKHDIFVDLHPGGRSGTLTNDVPIVWAGVIGCGWGVLTVDEFPNRADAEQCIHEATYAAPAK